MHSIPIEVVDIDVHQELAMDYGIRSVPTLIMKDGNTEVKRFSGVRSLKELEEWING
jgi:thioredoxin 1